MKKRLGIGGIVIAVGVLAAAVWFIAPRFRRYEPGTTEPSERTAG